MFPRIDVPCCVTSRTIIASYRTEIIKGDSTAEQYEAFATFCETYILLQRTYILTKEGINVPLKVILQRVLNTCKIRHPNSQF